MYLDPPPPTGAWETATTPVVLRPCRRLPGWGKRRGQRRSRSQLSRLAQPTNFTLVDKFRFCPLYNFTGKSLSYDHGGALVLKTKEGYKQIGIASFVYDKCDVPIPGGFSRVTYFLDWITKTAEITDD
ncbi:serine protease 44-like [Schistocerca piceifrons]|uniref:serine protease 44-like n=1 Tax=Schistocerca piceifrons TaxID=274613 RepID=UPI001F5F244F|nr:serine protease 44-like [Schistocerca piceifrons]